MYQKPARLFLFIPALIFYFHAPVHAHAQRHKKAKKEETVKAPEPWQVDTLIRPIPINRQMFTDRVAEGLRRIDARDGKVDNRISVEDTVTSDMLTDVILHRIPVIDIHIENLDTDHQTKIKYHRALENMIERFRNKSFESGDLSYFKKAAKNFEGLMIAIQEHTVKEFAHENANIYTLDNSELLDPYPEEKAYVFETVGKAEPAMMIKRLPSFAKEKYADPVVAAAARVVPGTILTYATSTSYLNSVVRRNPDPLVQTIARIASESRNPLKVLPFLGEIYEKKKTIAEIDAIAKDDKAYYKALVALKISGDTIGGQALDEEINYRGLQFVRVVNSLHESPDAVRFASLADFNAEELYFMMIGSQDEIYTSSFVWMFNRMMDKMKPETGNDFLVRVHKYHFRTWIRMCAGYNTLSPFLQSMPEDNKNNLMKEFVAGLEKGDANDLEDAVDVADAFGSITDPKLMDFLEKEVLQNYERCKNNEKGLIVYGLLSTIMKSASNSNELTDRLSIIPPITYVPYKQLENNAGKVIIQAFFYGDEDGRMSFASFKSNFPSNKWKSTANSDWITFTSDGTNPVIVYANLPKDEPEDEFAQRKLQAYLSDNNIHPTIIIHRGHSYHLDGSLEHLDPNVKIVMLGSCGGYHNLAKVLDKSPDANIISSKQTGAMSVNEPIIRELFTQLLAGKNVDWIQSWEDLNKYFSSRGAHEKDLFSDYVPPNKNLGAIFIKAYRKMQQQSEKL